MRHSVFSGLIGAIALFSSGCTPQSATKSPVVSAENTSIESEAKSSVGSLLFDQQTYFLENDKFALSVKQLNTSVLSETKNYRYGLTPRPDRYKGIVVTATSKNPNLRSYTGVVFAFKTGKESQTLSQICETMKPSSIAPDAPTSPQRASDRIKCPAGSHAADESLAQQ